MHAEYVKKNQLAVLVIALSIVAVIVVWYLFLQKSFAQVHALEGQIQGKAADEREIMERIKDLQGVGERLNTPAAKASLDKLSLAMPLDAQVAEVLVQIETIASRAGMRITSISTSESASGAKASAGKSNEAGGATNFLGVPITLTAEGTFADLTKYAQILERNLRPILVKSINVGAATKSENQPAGNALTTTFTIEMQYLAPQKAAASTSAAGAASPTPAPTATATPEGRQP